MDLKFSQYHHIMSFWRHRSFLPFLPGITWNNSWKKQNWSANDFILKEEPINFHLRGQPTFSDQNQESYAYFTADLRKTGFWWRHRQNMKKTKNKKQNLVYFFYPCLMYRVIKAIVPPKNTWSRLCGTKISRF